MIDAVKKTRLVYKNVHLALSKEHLKRMVVVQSLQQNIWKDDSNS